MADCVVVFVERAPYDLGSKHAPAAPAAAAAAAADARDVRVSCSDG